MIEQYQTHNLFRTNIKTFEEHDPHLSALKTFAFIHPMDWWRGIDFNEPGIFILTGGRQIGKSTSTKLLIKESLTNGMFPNENIFYLPCDQIDSHQELGQIIRAFLQTINTGKHFLLIIDEVTYVTEWDRAIKAIADEGSFRNGLCIITGSDSIILKDAISRFPGRRGRAAKTDFHIAPLNFKEYIELVDKSLIHSDENNSLFEYFNKYLRCGGHLRAINDLHGSGKILPATYTVFEQWIRGDFQKRERSVPYLKGTLKSLIETVGSQVTYSSLTNRIGELSKPTLIDYFNLLERLDVIFDLQAFDQNKHIGFPRKARKFHFWDPFILDTIKLWLERELELSTKSDMESVKIESIVAAHFKSHMPTFYFKGKGEIDVVTYRNKKATYIEVKWGKQIRSSDLEELKKRDNGIILTKTPGSGIIEGIKTHFLPRFLIENF